MKLKAISIAVMWAGLSGAATAHEMPAPCVPETYQGNDYTICRFDPSASDIRLFLKDDKGDVLGSFDAVNAQLANDGETLAFAMNAGMYHKDRSPVGGYGEKAKQVSPNNTNAGPGNFHMLPNGVFWIKETREDYVEPPEVYFDAYVGSTKSFEEGAHFVRDYTQSGPMLVIDGKLHPKFKAGSTSRKIRNGVGKSGSDLIFVKSEVPVNFHDFASLYKDHLKAENALYLDGTISRLFAPNLGRNDFGAKMGPIVGVVVPKVKSEAQYIANEAVLVTHGETKVMFDPLPLSGFGVYPETLATDIAQMMKGEGVYAGIDAVFISHAHRDHFSAVAIVEYMIAQPDVRVVMPQEAVEMVHAEFVDMEEWDNSVKSRFITLDMEAGDAPETISIGDITATAVRIPHAGWPAPARAKVQNMVYRVTLGDGATVMHMGDADPRRQHYIPHKEHWAEQRTDTAFPPYWFLTSMQGRNILSDDMNVAKSIGVHVPIKVPADLKASGQDYFSKNGEKREIGE